MSDFGTSRIVTRRLLRSALMGCGGLQGVRAGSYHCGGDIARDDVPTAHDLPVPVATYAVRGNVVSKRGFLGLDFDWRHHTSPRVDIIPIPRVARDKTNEIKARACVQNCSVRRFYLWSELLTLEFLFAAAHELTPVVRTTLHSILKSQAKKNPAQRGHPRRGFLHAFGHDGGRAPLCRSSSILAFGKSPSAQFATQCAKRNSDAIPTIHMGFNA